MCNYVAYNHFYKRRFFTFMLIIIVTLTLTLPEP